MSQPVFVTVITPCRNEQRFIGTCLESLLANDYSVDALEILVVDGMSTDRTREIVAGFAARHPHIRLIDNPKRSIPAAMNVGIRNARGDVILKADAHSLYREDYISQSVRYMQEYNADNVGGVLLSVAADKSAVAEAIAQVLRHPFGVGNAHFRTGSDKPRWADTVAFGCYRRGVFDRIGLYNEAVIRSSDMDLNSRLRSAGGKILLAPDIIAWYYPQANLKDFFRATMRNGFWVLYSLRYGGQAVKLRHLVPIASLLIFCGMLALIPLFHGIAWLLAALLACYLFLASKAAVQIGRAIGRIGVGVQVPVVLLSRHLSYAIGSLAGLLAMVPIIPVTALALFVSALFLTVSAFRAQGGLNPALLCWLLSAGLIFYVALLYPLMLAIGAQHRSLVSYPGPQPLHKVSVILAVYNGEAWIEQKIQSILSLDYPRELMEILIVSDGSTDSTDDLIQLHAQAGVELIRVPHNGKAAALNAAMTRATGDILFFTDVRQQLSPETLRKLVTCFADPKVGVASGELVIDEDKGPSGLNLYWKYESWIRSSMSRLGVLQGASGCIYAMRRELARPLPQHTLLDDVYLPIGVFLRGSSVVLESGAQAFDIQVDLRTEFRRKIRTLAGVYQVIRAYPQLLWPGTRGSFHFISHKVGRMLLPYALICCLVTSFWLPKPWNIVVITLQTLLYACALLDLAIPPSAFPKRYTSAASAFVVLMAAALFAVPAAFMPSRILWRSRSVQPPTSKP